MSSAETRKPATDSAPVKAGPDLQGLEPPLAYTIPRACAVSGLGRTSIYKLIGTGALPAFRCGGRRLILRRDLVAFLERSAAADARSQDDGTSASLRKPRDPTS